MASFRRCIAVTLLCSFLAAPPVQAQQGILDRTQEWLDGVGKRVREVGEKAEGIFGPGIGLGEEEKAAHTEERDVDDTKEVGPSPRVSVSNEFGEIHIDGWEERVVQVKAKVIVGAESANVAQEISRSIDVQISTQDGLVRVEPVLPDRHLDMGAISMQVNLYITVPRGSDLTLDNFFGDTFVRGLNGPVAVESQYGIVDLGDLGGRVMARVRGEFPLRAHGLKQGGLFQLHGSLAEFSNFGGSLQVNNFGGSVQLELLQPDTEVDVLSESGAVHLVLPPDATPDLTASTVYGAIRSELSVTRSEQGPRILARHGSQDARQRIDISGTFSDIAIDFEGSTGSAPDGARGGDKPLSEPRTMHADVTPYTKLQVEGIRGDITLIGTDDPGVHIYATPTVWAPNAKAPAALEALSVQVQKDADRLVVRSLLTGDMETLQCSEYRVGLKIEYPRNLPVKVLAEDGQTQVTGSSGTVTIEQTAGSVSAADCLGPLELTNNNGDVRVTGGAGPVEVQVRYGDTYFEGVQGAINVNCVQGDTIIDKPGAAVTVRNNIGNVRILALDSIAGNFDVLVETGDLGVVIGNAPYAELTVAVDKGTVDSAIPLDGEIEGRRKAQYRGYPRQGQYTMKLQAKDGDIILD